MLGVSYVSNFLETVNSFGNIGPGASGSALIDQNNRVVGSLTLGRTTSDPSGYGACPVSSPAAPDGTNGVADFTALAAVWNSTADTTSTTGSLTLKDVLDPGATGTTVVPSVPVVNLSLQVSAESLPVGGALDLTWNAPGATGCTAGGGAAGDGWTGSLPAAGTQTLTETQANLVEYSLSCGYPSGRKASASAGVSWTGPTPILQWFGHSQVWTSAPLALSWQSNVGPCAISGGGLALSNQPASGSLTTTQATAGLVEYVLTCGPVNQSASIPADIFYVTPSLVFSANGTDRRIGEVFFLQWDTAATSCTPSGGAPNDGWSNTEILPNPAYGPGASPHLVVSTPGTYTYALTCVGGPTSIQKSVAVTFENNAPYASLQLSKDSSRTRAPRRIG